MDTHEIYQTVLEGLGRYREDPLIGDVLRLLSRYPQTAVAHSLNKNQMASKRWLLESLLDTTPGPLQTVYVLGGWHGVLAALLLADSRFDVGRVISVDVDPDCPPLAETLNHRHLRDGRFAAVTADMTMLNYRADLVEFPYLDDQQRRQTLSPDLIVNTSCEHLADFDAWYHQLPADSLMVLQSNNFFSCEEHVNCVSDLNAFRDQAPMQTLLYEGALPLKRYTRFMLIGRK